jgi:hypothetical protein
VTLIRKYRQGLAALLFIAYAFIATPTQLWHSHGNTGTVSSIKTTDGDNLITDSGSNSIHSCLICAHKYAAYHNDAIVPFVSNIFSGSTTHDFVLQQFFPAPAFSLSNKGPPALI